MTVKELISQLQNYPPDAETYCWTSQEDLQLVTTTELNSVYINEEEGWVSETFPFGLSPTSPSSNKRIAVFIG